MAMYGGVEIDPEMQRIQQMQYDRDPSTLFYRKGQIANEMAAWNQKNAGFQDELKQLAFANARKQAQDILDNAGQGGPDIGYGRQYAQSILGNNNWWLNGIAQGRVLMPAGHALDYVDNSGVPVSQGLRNYAASSDLYHSMYDGPSLFGGTTLGSYKSMGIGGNNLAPTAFGGDGEQARRQDLYQNGLAAMEQNRQAARDWQVMNNKNPNGAYGDYGPGSARNGRDGIRQYGDPRQDTGIGGNLAWQPPFLRRKNPYGDGLGIGGQQEPVRVPTSQDTINENKQTTQEYQDRYGITPVDGGGAGYRAERNSHPYWQSTARTMSLPAFPVAMGAADSPVDARRFNANSFSPDYLNPPRQFGRTLSPDWLSNDIGQSQLFGYGQSPQRNTTSSSFDRWATDPYTAGQIGGIIMQPR